MIAGTEAGTPKIEIKIKIDVKAAQPGPVERPRRILGLEIKERPPWWDRRAWCPSRPIEEDVRGSA